MRTSIRRWVSVVFLSMGLISCIPSDSGGGGNDDDDDDRGGAMANGGMSGTGGVMIPGAGGGMEPGAGGMSMSVGGNMAPMGGMGPGPGPGLCDRICDSLADCVDGITVEDCMAQCEVVVDEDPEGGRLAESCAETYLAGGRCAIDDYSACASPGGGSEECDSGCDIITSCDPDEDFAECIVQCGELEARDPAYMNHVLNCIYTHLDNNECDFEAFEECENRGRMNGGGDARGCDYICDEMESCTDEAFDHQRCVIGCGDALGDDAEAFAAVADCADDWLAGGTCNLEQFDRCATNAAGGE